ncbi:MAG: YcxB family protein, partial [Paludibacter sp.]|nr:YcxB family protein [Paludibacter sp.]
MKIETKLEFKEYLNWNFYMTYKKPSRIILTLFWLCIFFSIFLSYSKLDWQPNLWLALLICLFFLGIMPITIYFSAKKLFKTNKIIQEKIIYNFQDEKIAIIGESFSSELTWEKLYKIIELKHFVLLYQSASTMNIIPKFAF